MKNKGAIELSVGTIVVIVLAVTLLVLGLVFIRTIFSSGTNAINQIDSKVRNQIDRLFQEEEQKLLAPVPLDQRINIEQGSQALGFGFILRNVNLETTEFEYTVEVDPSFNIRNKCGGLTKQEADNWLIQDTGSITLGPGRVQESGTLVLFTVPSNAPPCTIPYDVQVRERGGDFYSGVKMFVTVVGS